MLRISNDYPFLSSFLFSSLFLSIFLFPLSLLAKHHSPASHSDSRPPHPLSALSFVAEIDAAAAAVACRSSARRRRQTTNSDSIYSNYRDAQDLSGISFRILASRFRPSSALCQLPTRSLRFFPPSVFLRFVAPSSDYHARAGISFRSN